MAARFVYQPMVTEMQRGELAHHEPQSVSLWILGCDHEDKARMVRLCSPRQRPQPYQAFTQ